MRATDFCISGLYDGREGPWHSDPEAMAME